MSSDFIHFITSSALSLTMAGNTGISPFLTLLILGLVEIVKPELLNMGKTIEIILASWWSIAVLGVLTIVEMVGKCIPAVDEIIDSVEVFIVPVISILASMATMGLLPDAGTPQSDAGLGQDINVISILDTEYSGDGYRNLQDQVGKANLAGIEDIPSNELGEGFLTFMKCSLVAFGMLLALLIHFFKMLIRLSSMVCTAGCCQPCITVVEFLIVISGVILAILIPTFAVMACIAFLVAAGYVVVVKCCKTKDGKNHTTTSGVEVEVVGNNPEINDIECQPSACRTSNATIPTHVVLYPAETKVEFVRPVSPTTPTITPKEMIRNSSIGELVVVPLSPIQAKKDFQATTY
ncbi:unnamed protein product [Pseudo-nitzschia multistriata]|uniref:DUF4126 domain-containing protein n=1 Tax=Pseudo-nitzschia multistriata TaxID=183589 RepID=A0A448Z390_9STRA|nr:unnamed protein product [Pseudo-nitzschia multistriata]